MSEKCILYPNDLNYLNDSRTGDVLLVRDNHKTKPVFALAVRKGVNCFTVLKGLLWYSDERRQG